MSLLLWMPFTDGTPKQQGLGVVPFAGTAPAANNNGKLGKCGYSTTAYYCDNFTELSSNTYSIAYWIKYSAFPTYNEYVVCINGADSNDMLVSLGVQSSSGNLSVNASGSGTNLSLNTWYHVAYTHTGSTGKLYLNGNLIKTYSITGNTSASHLTINGRYGSRPLGTFYINDLRIYKDNALSPKEVEEIAKGLVLHYKLDDRFCEATTNLASGVAGYSFLTKNVDTYATTIDGKKTYGNKVFTYSAYIKNTSDAPLAVRFNPYNAADSSYSAFNGNYIQPGQEGYSSVTVDITNTSNWNGKVILYVQNGNAGTVPTNKTFYIREVQVEEKNHATPYVNGTRTPTTIYDSSGYSHNGTIVGSLAAAAPSPRYEIATQFPGSAYAKCTSPSTEVKTISLWAKWDSIPSGQSVIYVDYKSKTGLGLMSTGILCSSCGLDSYTFSKSSIVANTWYHFVVVSPSGAANTARKLYINGVEQTATSNTSNWSYTIDELQVGKRSTTSDGFIGKIVDFRMYTTALTAAQVKELYTTSMSVDSNGNIHARELSEL